MGMRTEAPGCCPCLDNSGLDPRELCTSHPLVLDRAVRFYNLHFSEKQSLFLFQEGILKEVLEENLTQQ
jgi:hypothetical protein